MEKGANFEAKDIDGKTPLHFACTNGHEKIVATHLEQGVNISAQDKFAQTPIYLASSKGHEKIVEILSHRGVKIETLQGERRWAQQLKGYEEIVKLISENANALQAQTIFEHTPIGQILLAKGAKKN